MTTGVELGAGVSGSRVQGDGLMADEVVSGLEAGGDGILDHAAGGHNLGLPTS
jgi:hypothetical protein